MPKKRKRLEWAKKSEMDFVIENQVDWRNFLQDKLDKEWDLDKITLEWDESDGKLENFLVYLDNFPKNKVYEIQEKINIVHDSLQNYLNKENKSIMADGTDKEIFKTYMKSTPSSEKKKTKEFIDHLLLLSFIFPKKIREEYIGDFLEDRESLKKRGLPKWKINLIAFGNILCLLITSRWIWFQGLFQSAFKYF